MEKLIPYLLAFLAAALAPDAIAQNGDRREQANDLPNFVSIMTDDQGYRYLGR